MEQHETGTQKDLALYRLDSAKDCLETAKILMDLGKFKSANNRSYYSILNAINAVHALNGVAYKRHKDVIANFNRDYIKTEIFPKVLGRKIAEAEEIRHASDYDDFYIALKDEADEQIATAEELLRLVEDYCNKQT
ncbi:MAG: HEPN domain-containing protein [Clostridia bacterium]|nr:HEPN domain-containing protein [Clostridia bacterium]